MISIPKAALKSTQLMWDAEPGPAEPYLRVGWFAFTYAMNSGSEFAGKAFGVISVRGDSSTRLTGVKSVLV